MGITAHLGLFRDAQLKVGENVFVHGGSGGVASCVVQMARPIGARVMTTAGSDEKVQMCRSLGANVAVNYRTGNVDEALGKFGPIDVWWENLREPNLERAVGHLAKRGRIIVMAGRDARPALPVGTVLHEGCRDPRLGHVQCPARRAAQGAAEINRWLAKGRLRPLIGRVMKLSEAAEAHRLQEDNTLQKKGALMGKIVLVP